MLLLPSYPLRAAGVLQNRVGVEMAISAANTANAGAGGGNANSNISLANRASFENSKVVREVTQKTLRDAAAAAASKGQNYSGMQVATTGGTIDLWRNAIAPMVETFTDSDNSQKNRMRIVQNDNQAYLKWQKFDLGQDETLYFDQSKGGSNASQWIAFNYIRDPSGNPSQIFGSIKAEGQVYILNANGILFGGTSQVNTHTLVASSLPINPNLIQRGLLVQDANSGDIEFLFSALASTPGFDPSVSTAVTPIQDPSLKDDGTPRKDKDGNPAQKSYGSIIIDAGAQLIAKDDTASHIGGRIALIGPKVSNSGTIIANDGQAILAAGLEVGFGPHSDSDPSVRGLDVYVGRVSDATVTDSITLPGQETGTVMNTSAGLIQAYRGNVTLAGKEVQHNGIIDSTTSVSLNGSVIISANYDAVPFNADIPFAPQTSGKIALGDYSQIYIWPLTTDRLSAVEKTTGNALPLRSTVNLRGESIVLGQAAVISLPNGDVALKAGEWIPATNGSSSTLEDKFLYTKPEDVISLASSATIDVAGLPNVSASVLENFVGVELRGPEFADSPLLRNNPALRGQKIVVDIRNHGAWDASSGNYTWIGTPLADARGYANLVQRTVEQLSTNGGNVDIHAGGVISLAQNSLVNVSGGLTNYSGGTVATSQVLYNGQWIDVANATPDKVYTGIRSDTTSVVDSKWSVTQTWYTPQLNLHYETGYSAGGDAGSIQIVAPVVGINGKLLGNATAGQRQLTLRPAATYWALPNDFIPKAGSFKLELSYQDPNDLSTPIVLTTPQIVVFSSDAKYAGSSDVLALSPDIVSPKSAGFGKVEINNPGGDLRVESNLELPSGGSLSLKGLNVFLSDGVQVVAPGGSLTFVANNLTPMEKKQAIDNAYDPVAERANRGLFKTGSDVVFDTSGKQIAISSSVDTAVLAPRVLDGGSVSINGLNLDFGIGNQIDVSGGILALGKSNITWGKGGTISMDGGRETQGSTAIFIDGKFNGLDNLSLRGYSGTQGGVLNLSAPYVQVGGKALAMGDPSASGRTIWLKQDANGDLAFFGQGAMNGYRQGGFATYAFTGFAGSAVDSPAVHIVEGSHIAPEVQSWQYTLADNENGVQLSSFIPEESGQLKAANFSFNAIGARDPRDNRYFLASGGLVMDAGSSIETNPGTSAGVTLKGSTVQMFGSIFSPGGSIRIRGGKTSDVFPGDPGTASEALATVEIGSRAVLSTAGKSIWVTANAQGYKIGSVLDGGLIEVAGNIVAEKGAVFDASGTADSLDVLPEQAGVASTSYSGNQRIRTEIDSNGGKITLTGSELLISDATLVAKAGALTKGSSSAQGGQLVITSGLFIPPGSIIPLDPSFSYNLALAKNESGVTIGDGFLRHSVVDNNTGLAALGGHLATDRFADGFDSSTGGVKIERGGFRSITLGGSVAFRGDVNLSASQELRIGDKGVIATDNNAHVLLTAPYVYMGRAFIGPLSSEQEINATDRLGLVDSSNQRVSANLLKGTGSFTVSASNIDVGNIAIEGFNKVTLKAIGGDFRGDGSLSLAGQLTIDAANVYPQTAGRLNLVAFDDVFNGAEMLGGKIEIMNSSHVMATPPLSAGGTLGIYASEIVQSGVLRAPLGSINLGKKTGSSATDPLSQQLLPDTSSLTLEDASITSVSARINDQTSLTLPYGVNLNGNAWIDPTSTDISQGGVPEKSITLSGSAVTQKASAVIDVSGGGDLLAYRWVTGLRGTKDILGAYASDTTFAVVPSYSWVGHQSYNPTNASAPYNTTPNPGNDNLGASGSRDPGYVNSNLSVGDSIYLDGVPGLAAANYTLLPARYALLPGAFLITKKTATPPSTAVALPAYSDPTTNNTLSSYLVRGYRFNALDTSRSRAPLYSSFEAASQEVVLQRAQYDYSSSEFLKSTAEKAGVVVPRLPQDAGRVLIASQVTLDLLGKLTAFAKQGRGSEVDISSAQNIIIGNADGQTSGELVLDVGSLNSFGAESLLIGGQRGSLLNDGRAISVSTGKIEVEASSQALSGQEIILAAKEEIAVKGKASIVQSGTVSGGAETLSIGDSTSSGSGNGALLRVTGDASAGVVRHGVDPTSSTSPTLTVENGASITGAVLTLDSSRDLNLGSLPDVNVGNLNLSSQQINVRFSGASGTERVSGLLLTGDLLTAIQKSTRRLNLTSYTSIDLYGSGNFGTYKNGAYSWDALSMHAGSVRGFDAFGNVAQNASDATVQFSATEITLDNRWSATGIDASSPLPSGVLSTLEFQTKNLTIGGYDGAAGDTGSSSASDHTIKLAQFGQVILNSSSSLLTTGIGRLESQGDLTIDTPQITGAANSNQTVVAGRALKTRNSGAGLVDSSTDGLGAKLSFSGQTINIGSGTAITAHSGTVSLQAAGLDSSVQTALVVGGSIDVSGASKVFQDSIQYTDAGHITLQSDQGSVLLDKSGVLTLSASGSGGAGTLSVSAINGGFSYPGTISANGGNNDPLLGGAFSLDVHLLPNTGALDSLLTSAGFTRSQAFRVRTGNVDMNGVAKTHSYSLSADIGAITVKSGAKIDASGHTGGSIYIAAQGDLVLEGNAKLDVTGLYNDDAGKGGSASLESVAGTIDLKESSAIALDIVNKGKSTSDELISDGVTGNRIDLADGGTLHLRALQTFDATTGSPNGIQIAEIKTSNISGASSIVLEGYRSLGYDLTDSGGYITDALKNKTRADADAFITALGLLDGSNKQSVAYKIAGSLDPALHGIVHFQPGAEITNKADVSKAPLAVNGNELALGTSSTMSGTNVLVLTTGGSTVALNNTSYLVPSPNNSIMFQGAVAAGSFKYTVPAGTIVTITKSDGTTNKITYTKATTNVSLAAQALGTTISFSTTGAKLTASSSTAASTPLALSTGAYTSTGSVTVAASAGDITLLNTWDLSGYRFNSEPGNLTMRAAGNLIFPAYSSGTGVSLTTSSAASLSDGFDPTLVTGNAVKKLWLAPLMASPSWSYRLIAGADIGAADFHRVSPIGGLAAGSGSLLLGQGATQLPASTNSKAPRDNILAGGTPGIATTTANYFYQTIRTGTGDIDIVSGRDLQLLNPVATIYTAGSLASDVPGFDKPLITSTSANGAVYAPASGYGVRGGNLSITAQQNIVRVDPVTGKDTSSLQMPSHWLYRRAQLGDNGKFYQTADGETYSTTWWVDYSNFFDDVATLGGGNLSLQAGQDIRNVNASVATNARLPGKDSNNNLIVPTPTKLVELGGGDLYVNSGSNIDGGVYYIERGRGVIGAQGGIATNATRFTGTSGQNPEDAAVDLLPTTFFVGKTSLSVQAGSDLVLGQVANAFLLPQAWTNRPDYSETANAAIPVSLFNTYDARTSIRVSALGGIVNIQGDQTLGSLDNLYTNTLKFSYGASQSADATIKQPWLRAIGVSYSGGYFDAYSFMPGTLKVTAFDGDVNIHGSLYLAPAANGTVELLAAGSLNGYQPIRLTTVGETASQATWSAARINLSDASFTTLPTIISPIAGASISATTVADGLGNFYRTISDGAVDASSTIDTKKSIHAGPQALHANDTEPVRLYAETGDVSGLSLQTGKIAKVIAGRDITDINLLLQNLDNSEVSVLAAGRDIVLYDPLSRLRLEQVKAGDLGLSFSSDSTSLLGDVQIGGPGTLEVLAGRDLDLGEGGKGTGIVSLADTLNPWLPSQGANIIAAAGVGLNSTLDANRQLIPNSTARFDFPGFIRTFLDPASAGENAVRYLPELGKFMNLSGAVDNNQVWLAFKNEMDGYTKEGPSDAARQVLSVFFTVLRDTGRDYGNPNSQGYRTYSNGRAAIQALFPNAQTTSGGLSAAVSSTISLASKNVRTKQGGDITLLNPFGKIDLGFDTPPSTGAPPGVITEYGGNIDIYADQSVSVGALRIFTLRGGDITIWSNRGNIAAGFSAKTVQSAPPTKVLIDLPSADLKNDLSGLATGGGIGVLATVAGVPPGDVDLIAPAGTIDAGDAGIRSSGKVNVSALVVVNAANIQSGGGTSGTPVVVAPSISGFTTASNAAAGANSSVGEAARQQQRAAAQQQEDVLPSIIQVEVLGYGGGEGEETAKKKNESANG